MPIAHLYPRPKGRGFTITKSDKSYVSSINDQALFDKVIELETRVKNDLLQIRTDVASIIANTVYSNPGEFARQHNTHPLFHLMIAVVRDREPDYNKYYTTTVIPNSFTKDCI